MFKSLELTDCKLFYHYNLMSYFWLYFCQINIILLMEETKSQYLKVIEKSRKVFNDKNSDYGSSWRILRVSSFVDQIHIKAQRIRNLQINEDQKIDEGQVSEFIGIINYCIMSLIQIQIGVVDEPDLKGSEAIELI